MTVPICPNLRSLSVIVLTPEKIGEPGAIVLSLPEEIGSIRKVKF